MLKSTLHLSFPAAHGSAIPAVTVEHPPRSTAWNGNNLRPPFPTVPYVELSSLREATGDFSESNIIGRGGFGIVYEVCTCYTTSISQN